VKNVVLPLVLVISLSLVFTTQDAFAVIPDCTTAGIKGTLTTDQMYIATVDGKLAKLQIGGLPMTDKGKFCIVGPFNTAAGANKKCTDIALDSSVAAPFPMYCVTFNSDSRLYSVDRNTGAVTEIGKLLRDCDVTKHIKSINTFEIDTAGLSYVGGFDGRFWNIDLATGCLTFRALLVDPDDPNPTNGLNLSGDGAYELIQADMFLTAQRCDKLHGPLSGHTVAANGHVDTGVGSVGCAVGEDGLYNVNLVTFDVTFIGTTGQKDAFAMDMRPFDGNLCGVTKGGTLFELKQDSTPVATMATSNIVGGGLLFANGGTALQQLVGGILVEINKLNLLVSLIFS
jgi:hypothetical protein